MKNLKTFEDYSDLDKQDEEKSKRNQISNFPHSAKEDAKKREEREEKSRKEDPDGMYPRDDKRYDDSNDSSYQGGWQDGMGKPSWLGESTVFKDMEIGATYTMFGSPDESGENRPMILKKTGDTEAQIVSKGDVKGVKVGEYVYVSPNGMYDLI